MARKKICVLGATGSIGKNTLDVVESNPDSFELVGLSANTDLSGLRALALRYPGIKLALSGLHGPVDGVDFVGKDAVVDLIREVGADIVVNGIAGAAGFIPSLAAIDCGSDLALANKETVVMAWPLVRERAAKSGARILPVDSEHSAVFHLTEAHGKDKLDEIVLTASGGPFRGWSVERLGGVSVAEALAHPTWDMGGKITIDSASLANKGLEVIEAVRLFDVSADQVRVVIHPQSKVHSLVRLVDGSLYAQISQPDMRVPIHNALFWPECRRTPFGKLDLAGQTLTFEKPDEQAFPMLPLAFEAARRGGLYPAAYNAADEVAVDAFIHGRLRFVEIPRVAAAVLDQNWEGGDQSVEAILEGDLRARMIAADAVERRMEAVQ